MSFIGVNMALEVQCVTKESDPDYSDCRSIESIGLPGRDVAVVTKTPPEVHKLLNDRDIYVEHDGERTPLMQAERQGYKYVKTQSNDTKDDNLLKQDSC